MAETDGKNGAPAGTGTAGGLQRRQREKRQEQSCGSRRRQQGGPRPRRRGNQGTQAGRKKRTYGNPCCASSTTKHRAAVRWACCPNVFLHLHPAKINATRWLQIHLGHGRHDVLRLHYAGRSTGTCSCFYYHPSKVVAFRDILYLEHDVPFGKILRNMHRWGAHLMVIMVELHMFRVFLTGSYKPPRQFKLRWWASCCWC